MARNGYGVEPCQVVGVLDMDAFEVQVYLKETVRNKRERDDIYNNMAVVLTHCSTPRIIAVNYIAKQQYGISRRCNVHTAKTLCMQKDGSLNNLYLMRKHKNVFNIGHKEVEKVEEEYRTAASDLVKDAIYGLRKSKNLAVVLESASCDEVVFDFTEEVDKRVRCMNWLHASCFTDRILFEYDLKVCCDDAASTADFYNGNYFDTRRILNERRIIMGAYLLEMFRREVFKKTGFESSGGVGMNLLQAKIALPIMKPRGMTLVAPKGFVNLSKNTLLEDAFTVSETKAERVNYSYNRTNNPMTMFEVSKINYVKMSYKTGLVLEDCMKLVSLCNGEYLTPVKEKSMTDTLSCGISYLRQYNIMFKDVKAVRLLLKAMLQLLCKKLYRERSRNNRYAGHINLEFNPTKEFNGKRFAKYKLAFTNEMLDLVESMTQNDTRSCRDKLMNQLMALYRGEELDGIYEYIQGVTYVVTHFLSYTDYENYSSDESTESF